MRASIIVPAYNAAATIENCLQALVAQDLPHSDYEIIVVDDGSTDATARLVEAFPRVRLICVSHRGPAAARNRGARAANGELLVFTDADCEPVSRWLSRLLAAFSQAERPVAAVKGAYCTRQRELIARFVQFEYEEKYAHMRRTRWIDFVDTYSAAYSREIFLQNGGFDEFFPSASVEDQEFSFRLAARGCAMVFAPEATVYHRHPTTIAAYARRKFRIGYWKVRVQRLYPEKNWRDTHTPPMLKIQVGLFLTALAIPLLIAFAGLPWWLLAIIALAFALSALPLVRFIAGRDRATALIAPILILVRAAALGCGLLAGACAEVSRSARLKRAVDVIGAVIALVVLSPLLALIALAVKFDSAGPVLFIQARAGKDGQPFRLYKFRSMVRDAEAQLGNVIAQNVLPPPVFKIPHDPRVTRVGRFLRRFSLDELPQFFNVLRGDMSLVGPRPEELGVVAQYGDWQRRRLAVRPGMTGPMQTQGRANLALDERVRLELAYIEHYSLWQDLCLLWDTLPVIIRGQGS